MNSSLPTSETTAREAFEQLERIVIEGLRHGFFECKISVEIMNGGKRSMTIQAGKSYRFVIPEADIPNYAAR